MADACARRALHAVEASSRGRSAVAAAAIPQTSLHGTPRAYPHWGPRLLTLRRLYRTVVASADMGIKTYSSHRSLRLIVTAATRDGATDWITHAAERRRKATAICAPIFYSAVAPFKPGKIEQNQIEPLSNERLEWTMTANACEAVVFDMDGIIIDSEEYWERARLAVVAEFGGSYHAGVAQDVMGMSPPEWSRYLREQIGVPLSEAWIVDEVVSRLADEYRRDRPFYPGAVDAVRAISARWPTGLASSSGRDLIDLVISLAGLEGAFTVTVSGAEVARGKPAPDVYVRAVQRLGAIPKRCVAIEDSANGIRAGKNAGMRVVAIPNAAFPPAPDAIALADIVLKRIGDLTPGVIDGVFAEVGG